MSKEKILAMQKQVTGKLMAAISMLLVSAILMCLTSYAWFILSTAPEVSNLKTTAGANGALEIALQSTGDDGERAAIKSGVGSSSAVQDVSAANLTWGSIVDLSNGYGLDRVSLYPARLNINTTTGGVHSENYLTVPQFGEDGRVMGLKPVTNTHYDSDTYGFVNNSNRGVTIMGFQDELESEARVITKSRQQILDTARSKVTAARVSLRAEMQDAISRNSVAIFGLLAMAAGKSLITNEEGETAVRDIVNTMDEVAAGADVAVRWAFMAEAAGDLANYAQSSTEQMEELGDLYARFLSMPLLSEDPEEETVFGISQKNGYTQVATAAELMTNAEANIANAKRFLARGSWLSAGSCLVSASSTLIWSYNKDKPGDIASGILYDIGARKQEDTIIMLKIDDPETDEYSLFADMAEILGDYTSDITVWLTPTMQIVGEDPADGSLKFNYHIQAASGSTWDTWKDTSDLNAATEADPIGTLGFVSKHLSGVKAPGNVSFNITISQVDAYGYAADFAFRCSETGKLMLQQSPVNRVDGGEAATMGVGSTLTFQISNDMTENQVTELLKSVYVVFMNTDTKGIYAVARPTDLSIDKQTVTGYLALFNYEIKEGELVVSDTKKTEQSILAMTADTEYNVTALVYLNGTTVSNAATSATEGLSLTGSVNLQFTSSEALTPMAYSGYKTDGIAMTMPGNEKNAWNNREIYAPGKRETYATKGGTRAARLGEVCVRARETKVVRNAS